MSVQELITDHLDLWTGAVTHKSGSGRSASGKNGKIELTGIKKLRDLILELAVRGKLVEQDPNDEPASVLLDRIAEEKTRLIKEGKIRRAKSQPAVELAEVDFELPSSWIWVRLGSVGQVVGGGTPKSGEPSYWSEKGIAWLTPADLYGLNEKYISFGKRDISRLGLEKSSAQLLPEGAVLFSSRAPIGYVAIAAKELATNQGFKSCAPYIRDVSQFVYYFLKRSARHIDASASGTTFKEVSGSKVASIPMPLPPLEEQHRIVEKVDELMALCDRLEQQVGDQLETHEVLVDTLLDALTHSTDAAELAEYWARVAEHFDTLFTTEASIDKLKQTILQLAVMGRLVEQDPNDEPARVLLERIAEETDRLVTEGKIKKVKNLPPVKDDERTFGIPKGWEWVHFSDVVKDLKYGTSKKCYYDHKNTAVLRIPNVAEGQVSTKDLKFAEMSQQEQNDFILSPGDLLFIRSNGSSSIVGRCAIIDKEMHGYAYAGYLVRARIFTRYIHTKYLKLTMDSLAVRKQIEQPIRTTSGVKNINSTELKRIVFPLPPLDEQHRIVDKVEELMALCDQLKARMSKAGETRSQLAEAVVDQAVS